MEIYPPSPENYNRQIVDEWRQLASEDSAEEEIETTDVSPWSFINRRSLYEFRRFA